MSGIVPSFSVLIEKHLEWMLVTNYSERTVYTRRYDLNTFKGWCEERELHEVASITKPVIDRYQRFLYYYRKKDGNPLSFSRQMGRLIAIRGFFKWCTKQNYLLFNPASEIDLPRKEQRLPEVVFTPEEVGIILSQPNINTPYGLRDRTMLEVLYATGMRRRECTHLQVSDLDIERQTLFIRQGKMKKDRYVPVGERALYWLQQYLKDARPKLCRNSGEYALFLTYKGVQMSDAGLSSIATRCIAGANLGKSGACHAFRHAMATSMLDNGADIRYIQAILGHSKLESTQAYTHVSIEKLKDIHNAAHPCAKLRN